MKFTNRLRRGAFLAAALLATSAAYAAPPAGWTKMADENGRFTLSSSTAVAYGAASAYVTRTLNSGSQLCNTATFLSDPTPGIKKACYANLSIPTGTAPTAGTLLAKEDFFTIPATTVVSFGYNGQNVTRTLAAGKYRCGTELFVTDPSPGNTKSCVSQGASGGAPTPPVGPGTYLATQGGTFTLSASRVVSYGVNGSYVQATLTSGSKTCQTSAFPSDPSPGNTKYCYDIGAPGSTPTPPTGPGAYLATQGGTFTLSGTHTVKYGVGGNGATYVQANLPTGSNTCQTSAFPSDPAPGSTKYCYDMGVVVATPPAGPGPYLATAPSGMFTLAAQHVVALTKDNSSNKAVALMAAGAQTCVASAFPSNPYPGVQEYCYDLGAPPAGPGTLLAVGTGSYTLAATHTVKYGVGSTFLTADLTAGSHTCQLSDFTGTDPAPGLTKYCYDMGATVVAATGDVLDSNGNVAPVAYRAMAAQLNTDAGIAYRYGATTAAINGLPAIQQLADVPYPAGAGLGIPSTYQFGDVAGYTTDPGDYSATTGQVAFVPDNSTTTLGIDQLQFTMQTHGVFSVAPQAFWPYGGEVQDRNALNNYQAGTPNAIGRCYARTTWCVETIMAFPNGLIGVDGSNTSSNIASTQLAAGKVPTSVAVTNGSEFALITVWDTINLKGQLAVVVLNGGYFGQEYWGEWVTQHPGLNNLGNIDYMKVLGYIDLPGMNAPTEVSATTGVDSEAMNRLYLPNDPAFKNHFQVPLETESNRLTFQPNGSNYSTYAHGGMAVVISKSEKKAAFIDLKPLFDYYQSMYFGTPQNFALTQTLGSADNQWPYTFANTPSQMPTVVKTVTLANKPTAVKTTLAGPVANQRAWIATEDGTLQMYSLSTYGKDGAGATPAGIALAGTVTGIGTNPTSLTYVKDDPVTGGPAGTLDHNLIVVSRGDKKVNWIQFAADNNSGTIYRTLQDTVLHDPVSAEQDDAHGTTSYVLTVTDYGGKQLLNYVFGPVIINSLGGCQGPSGCTLPSGQTFTRGAPYAMPGKPFQASGANVP